MIAAMRWLIADTFRQSLASGVFWLMLAANVVCILGSFVAGFTPLAADEAHVQHLEFALAGIGANTAGLLLALAFTAGVLPAFTDPNTALILLAKPLPRRLMFLGKFLGVLTLFTVHATIFVAGTWMALGLSTGAWPVAYLAALPVLVLNFATFFSFSALLAVMTRGTVTCILGSIVFWLLCLMMNVGRHALVAYDLEQFSTASRLLCEAGYWILPKPADSIALLHDLLNSEPLTNRFEDIGRADARGAFRPLLSLAASFGFAVVTTALAARELDTVDY